MTPDGVVLIIGGLVVVGGMCLVLYVEVIEWWRRRPERKLARREAKVRKRWQHEQQIEEDYQAVLEMIYSADELEVIRSE